MPAEQRINLCVFCHGLAGDRNDWNTWIPWLERQCPTWRLKACESVTKGSMPVIGEGLHTLAELLAEEVLRTIEELRTEVFWSSRELRPEQEWEEEMTALTLHCIGHSMGGVILRGALARIFEAEPTLEAGVFMSLSSPHLGVQASWGAPQDMWRNFSFVLRPFSGHQKGQSWHMSRVVHLYRRHQPSKCEPSGLR